MHSLETILRINQEYPGAPRRTAPLSHPRLLALRDDVLRLPFNDEYRAALLRGLVRYGGEIVDRPGKASAAVGIFIGFCLNENMAFRLTLGSQPT